MPSTAQVVKRVSRISSRVAANSLSITSCSTLQGKKGAQAARVSCALGDLSLLNSLDTTFVVVSRAPLAQLEAYKAQKGWSISWFSSFGSDFNYDFHVTLDLKVAPAEYNYRSKAEMEPKTGRPVLFDGEEHSLSVFFRLDDDVFHSFSAYARGCGSLTDAYRLLDTTPYGLQQDFEDSPRGWPQKPIYG